MADVGQAVRALPGFSDFAEAFCAGFNARRDGLTDTDGEEFMRGLMTAYERSGSQRVRLMTSSEIDDLISANVRGEKPGAC